MSQEIGQISAALSKAQGAMSAVLKNHENPFFKSSYADLADGWEVCRDVLAANELAVFQGVSTSEQSHLVVTTMLAHSSGEWVRDSLTLAPVKEDPQAAGSAITYGRRYSLFAMVGLAPQDDDDGEATLGRGKKKEARPKSKPAPATPPDDEAPPEQPKKCPVCGEAACAKLAWGKGMWSYASPMYTFQDTDGSTSLNEGMLRSSLAGILQVVTDERVQEWTQESIHELTEDERKKAKAQAMVELEAFKKDKKDSPF